MRLTLRTLLAYLDDTLEPAKAKEIGQKVAESDAARDLVERIKQVTRRRRLAAPQVSGPGNKLDPNTIAEYLDNEVSPETAAEVEAICLASDVHLAEVAACHQILTLVLGEPMTVPPTAKQRMYGLVKGPEAIPFRKPATPKKEKDVEAATPARDLDDTLRLGLPPVGTKSSLASKLLLFGGGFVAACLLLVALWQVLNWNSTKKDNDADKALVKADDKDKDKSLDKEKDKDKTPEPIKDKEKDKVEKVKDKKEDKEKDKDGKDEKKVEEVHLVDIPLEEPNVNTVKTIGQYQADEGKDTVVCLQEVEKGDWRRVTTSKSEVLSGRPLLSLPGSWSSIYLPVGLRLTMTGNVPEILGAPIPLYESKVILHHHDKLSLDLTLLRGQIILSSVKDRPLQVRVRFANPFDPARPEHYDVLLHNKGTEVLFGLTSSYLEGEPFYPNPKDKQRKGPVNFVACMVIKGFASVKFGDVTYGRGPVSLFQWNSMAGPTGPNEIKDASIAQPELPLPEDEKAKTQLENVRNAMKKARSNLAYFISDAKPVDGKSTVRIKLLEALQSTEPDKRFDPKAPPLTRIMLARLAVRSIGALGNTEDVSALLELLDPPMNDEVRFVARDTLINWLAADRDNDYVLHGLLVEKYKKVQAERIMRLMHGLPKSDLAEPATYQELIELLDNGNSVVRELAAYRLYQVVPFGRGIPYSAWESQDFRQAAQAAWRTIIPPGSLPLPPKEKKGKG